MGLDDARIDIDILSETLCMVLWCTEVIKKGIVTFTITNGECLHAICKVLCPSLADSHSNDKLEIHTGFCHCYLVIVGKEDYKSASSQLVVQDQKFGRSILKQLPACMQGCYDENPRRDQ